MEPPDVRMLQRFFRGESFLRIEDEQLLDEIDRVFVDGTRGDAPGTGRQQRSDRSSLDALERGGGGLVQKRSAVMRLDGVDVGARGFLDRRHDAL